MCFQPSVGNLSIVISYDVLTVDGEMDASAEDIICHISTSDGLGIQAEMNKMKKNKKYCEKNII